MRFDDRPIFKSPMVTAGILRCHPSHPEFWYENPANGNLLVFPRSGVRILQTGNRPVVADPNVAIFTIANNFIGVNRFVSRAIVASGFHFRTRSCKR